MLYEATAATGPFTVTAAPPVSITSFTKNVKSPVAAGTTVTWTAAVTGGVGPLQYEFWVQSPLDSVWRVFRPYGTSATAAWVAPHQGTFNVGVRVRSAGSAVASEASQTFSNVQVSTAAPSIPVFTADRLFPVPPGTTVTWTAEAGGTGPLEYAFWTFRAGTGQWTQAQAYSPVQTFAWTPTILDTYTVQVRVRPIGSTAAYVAYRNVTGAVVSSGAIQSVGLSVSQRLPVTVTTPIRWTATAAGGTAPLHFQYWLYEVNSGVWTMVQDYSPTPTYTWTPSPALFGQYALQVWIRQAGSTAAYEAYAASGYFTVTP